MDFYGVLMEFAPLFGLSFSIFALKGFRLSHSLRWTGGVWMHMVDIVLSSAVGAFLIVGFCIMARVFKRDLDGVAIIGLAAFLSVGGVSLVDGILFKYFGVHILDSGAERKGELRRKEDDNGE